MRKMKNDLKVKVIVSEGIETQSNGMQQRQIIVNPIINLRTRFIPTSLSLGVTVIVAGLEANTNYNLQIILAHTESDTVIFDTGVQPFNSTNAVDNFLANIDLKNLEVENEGEYTVRVLINDIEKKILSLF